MKKTISVLIAMLMLLSLCACGSSSTRSASTAASEYAYDSAPAAVSDMYYEDEYYEEYAAEPEGLSATTADGGETGSEAPEVDPDKIIYSANVTVETTEFDASLEGLNALIEKYNGWVETSSINGSNYYNTSRGYTSNRSASYTIRIPSESFNTAMTSLSEIGSVPYTYVYTENVTSQYYDVQARLTAYETQEARLLEMMELAETVSDVITIEDRLTELRYEIESLQSTLNNWDRQVSYSYIYLDLEEVQEYTPETDTKISYARELWLALTRALKDTGEFFKNLLVFLVSALPTIVILTALFFLLRPLFRRYRANSGKRAERRAAKSAAKAEKKAAKKAERAGLKSEEPSGENKE